MLKTRILVVDDSLVARRMLITQLKEIGFRSIIVAENGEQAIHRLVEARINQSPVGLIITDLRMPHMSGTDLISKIGEIPDFKSIPKLIVSVETERNTVLQTVLNGADGYILKPTNTELLKNKIEKVLSNQLKKAAS